MTERRDLVKDLLFWLLVAAALFAMLFPFYWIFATSLKAPGEVFTRTFPSLVPRSFFLETTEIQLEGQGVAAEPAEANKILSEMLGKNASVVQYSVDFSKPQGVVDLSYDRRETDVKALGRQFEALGYRVLAVAEPKAFPVLENYQRVQTEQPFLTFLLNSAVVATLTTIFCLLIGSLCGYALARLEFPFRDAILSMVLAVSMFPPIAVVSPLFLLMKQAHLLNTYWALILPYTAFGLPLTIWTLTSFFRELPRDLEEAARVDGCTRFQAFHKVILPLAAPGVFTCAILVFIGAWNEFLFALVFVTKTALRTVPVGITMYPGQYEMPWGTIFAAATIVTLPLVVVVFLFQKRIIAGLTAGAVKG